MKRYVYLSDENVVINIIFEFDDRFPNVPIHKRYSEEFLKKCVVVDDEEIEIQQHYIYNAETNSFEAKKEEPIEIVDDVVVEEKTEQAENEEA